MTRALLLLALLVPLSGCMVAVAAAMLAAELAVQANCERAADRCQDDYDGEPECDSLGCRL